MGGSLKPGSSLNPALRERLLKESRNPWKGIRRALWVAFFGSAFIGLLIMGSKGIIGESVSINDAGIQLSALILFGGLLYLDRPKNNE